MDKDYQNFVDRMHSFDDTMDLTDNDSEVYQSDSKIIVTRNRSALVNNGNELQHFGKLGMKWGHHKSVNVNTIGKAAKTGQDLASLGQSVNKAGFNKKTSKEAKDMSDDELKRLTNRLNLENNYINAKQQQTGRSKVEGILSVAGSTLAVASSAAALYTAIKK